MAGGPAGDVHGPQGDEGRPGPELHRQDSRIVELVAGQEAAQQDGGERHPVDHRRTNFDRIMFFDILSQTLNDPFSVHRLRIVAQQTFV